MSVLHTHGEGAQRSKYAGVNTQTQAKAQLALCASVSFAQLSCKFEMILMLKSVKKTSLKAILLFTV